MKLSRSAIASTILGLVFTHAGVATPIPSSDDAVTSTRLPLPVRADTTASYNPVTASTSDLSPSALSLLSAISSDNSVFPSGTSTIAHVPTVTTDANGVKWVSFTSTSTAADGEETTIVGMTTAWQGPSAAATFSPAITSFTMNGAVSVRGSNGVTVGMALLSVVLSSLL